MATLAVELSDDRMAAFVALPAGGLAKFTQDSVLRALQENGVQHGIEMKLIAARIAALESGARVADGERVCVARGTAPDGGAAPRIRVAFKRGAVVGRNALIGRVVEGRAPRPGRTVTGEEVPARDGSGASFPTAGPNVRYDEQRRVWETIVPGYPAFENGTVSVHPLVRISDDEMTATLLLRPAADDTLIPDLATLTRLLEEADVVYGVRHDVLAEALQAYASRPGQAMPLVVARGRPEIRGQDGAIRFSVDLGTGRGLVTQDGHVDFHRLNLIHDVVAGELLARRVPPTEGIAGRTVTGKVLMAQPGRERVVAVGDNVTSSKDGLEYRSRIDGIFLVSDNRLRVANSYTVAGDVDLTTGDIETRHGVEIHGSVRAAFTVRAGGTIRVGEHVEDAIVESGAAVDVKGGICHRTLGLLRARGDVRAKYALNADVQTEGSIELGESALHSSLVAGDGVRMLRGRGVILGGRAIAGNSLEVNVAGSKLGVPTILRVGHDHRAIEPVETKLRKVSADMVRILSMAGSALLTLIQDPAAEPADEQLRAYLRRWRALERKKQVLVEQRDRVLEKSAEHMAGNPSILVRGTIYPGVRLIIGKACLAVAAAIPGGRFVFCHETKTVGRA